MCGCGGGSGGWISLNCHLLNLPREWVKVAITLCPKLKHNHIISLI